MKHSAGILVFRRVARAPEVLLAHPGGPFWRNKDEGAWSIPKGEINEGEDRLAAAVREFEEETGLRLLGEFVSLGAIKQKGGKVVHAWALEQELDPGSFTSNLCEIEWPPRSGRKQLIPEIDRLAWFDLPTARRKILASQAELLARLEERLTPAAPS